MRAKKLITEKKKLARNTGKLRKKVINVKKWKL
jgi:hypothetical protein